MIRTITRIAVLAMLATAALGTSDAGASHGARRAPAYDGPGRVAGLRIVSRTSQTALISWRRATGGAAPVEGYRVFRDGVVVGETHGLRYRLRLSASVAHHLEVRAVDTRGHLGRRGGRLFAAAVSPQAEGAAPGTPTDLTAGEVSAAGATISWGASRPGSAPLVGYRVYMNGRTVAQTAQTALRLGRLSYRQSYAVTVAAIDSLNRSGPATAPLRLSVSHIPPEPPARLGAERVTDSSASISWSPGSAYAGTVTGYELFKNGVAVGVIHGQSETVALASARSYSFLVRTIDSGGYLSAPSPELTVLTTHTPPPAPTGLSVSGLTSDSAILSWTPSTAVSGQIVGYRVFRDGVPVAQVGEPTLTLTGMAPSSEYSLSVIAVDSLGAVSAPTAPLIIHTAEPVPSHGTVQAFLLASTSQSFEDLEAHYQQIGVVYPTYFECGPAGAVTGANEPLITGWAEARKIAVMPRVNCQNVAYEEQVLNDPPAREAMIDRLVALSETYDYAGVQTDFEGAAPSERSAFTEFSTLLAERLHAEGRKLSTTVTAKTYNAMTGRAAMYDDAALSEISDYVVVLDWGLHWLTSGPGSIDEYGWFKKVAEYTATLPNRSRFVLGMPMYGIDWPGKGGLTDPGTPLEYANILALESEYSIAPQWEPTALSPHFDYTDAGGTSHEVWFTDRQSIGARAELASSLGLTLGLWRLGEEDQSVWTLPQLGGA